MPITHVKSISHVALKTRMVDQQANFYSHIVGLGETERDEAGRVYLRCNSNHHSVVLVPSTETGLDHFALDVGSPVELEAAANALSSAGIAYETEGVAEVGQGKSVDRGGRRII